MKKLIDLCNKQLAAQDRRLEKQERRHEEQECCHEEQERRHEEQMKVLHDIISNRPPSIENEGTTPTTSTVVAT